MRLWESEKAKCQIKILKKLQLSEPVFFFRVPFKGLVSPTLSSSRQVCVEVEIKDNWLGAKQRQSHQASAQSTPSQTAGSGGQTLDEAVCMHQHTSAWNQRRTSRMFWILA